MVEMLKLPLILILLDIAEQPIINDYAEIGCRELIISLCEELDIKGIHVEIHLNKKMRSYKGHELWACTERINDLTFHIYLDKRQIRKGRDFDRIIRHEMIHIWQFYTGRLKSLPGYEVQWEGQIYDVTRMRYRHRPWEKEAYQMDNFFTE